MYFFINNLVPELNNIFLYEKDGVNECLNFAKTLRDGYPYDVDFYMYWIGEPNNSHQLLTIKSFLITQPKRKLIIYGDHNISKIKENILSNLDLIKDRLEFRFFDVNEESKNTILENSKHLNLIKNHLVTPAVESDFFRTLILHKYGGVYCDFDMIFLRDFSPLLKYEFVYKWQDYSVQHLNGAVMRLIKNSEISNQLINEINNRQEYPMNWGSNSYCSIAMRNQNFIVFPAAFFDPEWQSGIKLDLNFSNHKESTNLFDGSFAWHWHGQYHKKAAENSKFEILEKIIDKNINLLEY